MTAVLFGTLPAWFVSRADLQQTLGSLDRLYVRSPLTGGTVPLSFFSQPYEVSIQTTYWGSRFELAEVIGLAARGLVHTESTTYSLDDARQAYRDLRDGKVYGRAVVVP